MFGFYCVKHFDFTPVLQIHVYTNSAQVARLTTFPIDFTIKLPTKWYIATLVPRWAATKLFLGSHLTD